MLGLPAGPLLRMVKFEFPAAAPFARRGGPLPRRYLAGLAPALAALAAIAQAPPTTEEPAQRIEIRSRAPDDEDLRRRDPVATTVVGRAELDRYGDTRLADVLARQPGVTMAGGQPRLRGLGQGYTQVLVNGEPAPPGFSLDELAPDQVERVEITKAPSAEHSVQAVAGTVNIVLRQPPKQRQRELKLGASKTGTNPVGWASLTLGGRFGPLDLVSPLSLYQWEWTQASVSERVSRDAAGDPQRLHAVGQSGGRGQGVSWGPRLAWSPSAADRINAQLFVQRNRSRYASEADIAVREGLPPPSVRDLALNHSHWQFQRATISAQHRGEDGSRLEMRASGQSSANDFDNRSDGRDGSGLQTVQRRNAGESRERGSSAALKGSWPFGETLTAAAGAEAERRLRREVRTVTDFGTEQLVGIDGAPFEVRIDRWALFAQADWRLDAGLSGYVGVRGERLLTASSGPADSFAQGSTVIAPLLHLAWRPHAQRREQWRFSLTRSYRAPEPSSLSGRPSVNPNVALDSTNPPSEPDRVGNPMLRPELATGIDLAWERPLGDGGAGGSFVASAFTRRIANTIRTALTLENVPWASAPRWVQRPANVGSAVSRGLEFEVKGRAGALLAPWVDPAIAIDLRLAGSFYRSQVDGVPGPGNRIEGQPARAINAGIDHRASGGGLVWGLSVSWTPSYTTRLAEDRWSRTGSDQRLDAYVLWRFDPGASLRLSGANLLPRDGVSGSTLIDEFGLAQGTDSRRESRRRWSATLELKF